MSREDMPPEVSNTKSKMAFVIRVIFTLQFLYHQFLAFFSIKSFLVNITISFINDKTSAAEGLSGNGNKRAMALETCGN